MGIFGEVIVCYDVESNARRNKLVKELKKLGLIRIQKSVFWGRILATEKRNTILLFQKILCKDEDTAFIVQAPLSSVIENSSFGILDKEVFSDKSYETI